MEDAEGLTFSQLIYVTIEDYEDLKTYIYEKNLKEFSDYYLVVNRLKLVTCSKINS